MKLIKFIAENLNISQKLVIPEASLSALSAISLYFGDDNTRRAMYEVNLDRLKEKVDNPDQFGRTLIFDLTKYFKVERGYTLKLEDILGVDGFCDLQLKRDLLVLEIEQHLGFPNKDEEIEDFSKLSVQDLINLYSNEFE